MCIAQNINIGTVTIVRAHQHIPSSPFIIVNINAPIRNAEQTPNNIV